MELKAKNQFPPHPLLITTFDDINTKKVNTTKRQIGRLKKWMGDICLQIWLSFDSAVTDRDFPLIGATATCRTVIALSSLRRSSMKQISTSRELQFVEIACGNYESGQIWR